MFKRTPPPVDPGLQQIADLEHAIVQAQEDNWTHHAVPETERDRLRPSVRALATAVADQLRAEHLARTAQP